MPSHREASEIRAACEEREAEKGEKRTKAEPDRNGAHQWDQGCLASVTHKLGPCLPGLQEGKRKGEGLLWSSIGTWRQW